MSYDGYFQLGGRELINSARVEAYLAALAPRMNFRSTVDSSNLALALGDADYQNPVADGAPWIDSSNGNTARFYGVYPIGVTGLEDSTRAAKVTESLENGGSIGNVRDAVRQVHVKVVLFAADELAMEAGWTWFKATLAADSCGLHGNACGGADLCFFADKPNVFPDMVSSTAAGDTLPYYSVGVGVPLIFTPSGVISGPRDATWRPDYVDGAIVQYSSLDLTDPTVIEQSPVIYLRRTNYITNPRFALDTVGWTPSTGTLTREVDSLGVPNALLDQASPATFKTNWLPDPSFEHGAPTLYGWRSNTPGGVSQTTDGTAPQGGHVATVPAVVGETQLETSVVGPVTGTDTTISGWLSFYSALNTDDIVVTIYDNNGVLAQTNTISHTALSSAWQRVGFAVPAYKKDYVIRLTTAGLHELRVDGFLLDENTSASTYYDGNTTAGGGTSYYFVDGDPTHGSRALTGSLTGFTSVTADSTTPFGPAILTLQGRADYESSVTVQLLDPSNTVLATETFTLTQTWTRHSLSAVNAQQAHIKIIGTSGPVQIRNVQLEVGTTILPYFDGDSVAPAGYTSAWTGPSNTSESQQDYTTPMTLSYDYPEWRPQFTVLAGTIPEVDLDYNFLIPADINECVEPYERRLHDVVCIAGPTISGKITVGHRNLTSGSDVGSPGVVRTADFVLAAATPYTFSNTSDIPLTLTDVLYSDTQANYSVNPSAEVSAVGYTAIPGTGGTAACTSAAPSTTTAFGAKVLATTWSAGSSAAGGGVLMAVPINAGYTYSFGFGHIKSSITNRLQLIVDWYNAGTYLSSSLGAQFVATGGAINAGTQLVDVVAPATATIAQVKVVSVAGTSYANWSAGSYLEVDGMMVNFGATLLPYLDGDTPDTTAYEYAWDGTTGLSTSRRSIPVPVTATELVDPMLPAYPAPPRPPVIPDPAVATQPNEWLRYFAQIPASEVSGWADTVPTLTFVSGATAERYIRVRFTPNPFNYDPSILDPASYCAEYVLSYLPALATLAVDGTVERAWASVAGGVEQPAERLLYATGGGPPTWPELSCNIPYLMTIDVQPAADPANLTVLLSLTNRE